MKTKSFRDSQLAVQYAHNCQEGGKSCALVIKRDYFVVCPLDLVEHYRNENDQAEYFDAETTSTR